MAALLKGKWRIVEIELWDKDFLDMMDPPTLHSTARLAASSLSAVSLQAYTAARPHQALTSPGKATTKWTKLPVMVGRNVKKTDRSKAKSASTMVTIQPSKLAHGEFLLAPGAK